MVTSRTDRAAAEPVPGARVLIVEARYYEALADELLAGARAVLETAEAEVEVVTVPGALEVPIAAEIALEGAELAGRPFDAVVGLGCVIRGETYHFEIVAGESSRALMDLSVARKLALGNGILTVETDEQAWVRARITEGNKGAGAVEAAFAVLRHQRQLAGV